MFRSTVLLMLLSTGCVGHRLHVDIGVANPWLGGQRWYSENVNPLRSVQGAVHMESTWMDSTWIALDTGFGPMILGGDQGIVVGMENLTRIRVKIHPRAHPYLVSKNGVGYASGWRGSDVNYTFTTSFGIGAIFGIRPHLSMTVDMSWYHHSNGMTVHSDKTRQFFGLAKATRNKGYQNLMVTIGFIWRF